VVDVETGGFDPQRHPLLEIADSIIRMDDKGLLIPAPPLPCHVLPFIGSEIDPRALAFNGIDLDHPFRHAVPEREALTRILFLSFMSRVAIPQNSMALTLSERDLHGKVIRKSVVVTFEVIE